MTQETIHALKLRIWKQSPKQRTELLSDLEAALVIQAGDAQEAQLAAITQRVHRAELLREKQLARKEKALQAAEDKLRQDVGF